MKGGKKLAVEQLVFDLAALGLTFKRELQFAKALKRRWRSDIAFIDDRLLIEVDGGTWTGGRHTRGAGYESDCEKQNTAVLLGYRVLRFTSNQVYSGYALSAILTALEFTEKEAA